MTPISHVQTYMQETAKIAALIDYSAIANLAHALADLRKRNGRLFIVGLGGSAATASHAANDFRKLCGLETYALNDFGPELLARANDEGWQTVYSGLLGSCNADSNDELLVLSVGGATPSVSLPIGYAVRDALTRGMAVYGIVGRDGGYTAEHADICVLIPVINPERVTPHTEGFTSVVLHALVSDPVLQQSKTKW